MLAPTLNLTAHPILIGPCPPLPPSTGEGIRPRELIVGLTTQYRATGRHIIYS